ncbi:YwgA family protein [Paenisporosarcina sp.]|uniref:YwgA family protein n=1 Tax=Paenisporosarcina sp. TaxID=1932001 RepID=UPI003C70F6D0
MLQEHAKIVQFITLAGEVTGRKKLQKMVYIAKKMNFPYQEKYQFHMFGPYSEELTLRVEELCNMDFISEKMEDKGSYVQYTYACTEEGRQFLSTMSTHHENLDQCIDRLNIKSSRFLEMVSTLLYFDYLPREEQIEKLHVVKGKLNFSETEIEEAFAFVEDLQAVITC